MDVEGDHVDRVEVLANDFFCCDSHGVQRELLIPWVMLDDTGRYQN
ncbi:hypothetical protein LFM09_48090 [Lentzea alba]